MEEENNNKVNAKKSSVKKTSNKSKTNKKSSTTNKAKSTTRKSNNTKTTNAKKSTKTTTKKSSNVKENKLVKDEELKIEQIIPEDKSKDLVESKTTEYYDILGQEKSHILLKILVVILLLAVGIGIIYKFVIRDQKAIFSSGLNTIYEKLANNIVKISKSDLFKDNIDIDGVLTINTNDNNNSDLNNYLFDVNLGINKSNNNFKTNINLKNNNKIITSLNYYYINNNYYLDLGNNYNKTLKLNNSIISFDPSIINYFKIDFNKLNTSAKSIKNIINSNIDRNKLTLGEESINNDKLEFVELKLTNSEYSSIISNIINDIKNNNNLISNLSESFNIDDNTLLTYLEDIQKNNLTNDFDNISFKFYTQGFMANIVGFKIQTDNNIIFDYLNYEHNNNCDNCEKNINNVTINYNNYNVYIDKINNDYNVIIKKDNNDYLHLIFKEINNDKIDCDYEYIQNNIKGNIHLENYNKAKDKSGNLKYTISENNITYSYNYDYIINDKSNINLNNNNYINIDDLSEDDYLSIENSISKNISNNLIKNKYIELFEKVYNY